MVSKLVQLSPLKLNNEQIANVKIKRCFNYTPHYIDAW
jgi:hypothetical protein